MSPSADPSDVLLARFLAAGCSPAEAREIDAQLAARPELRRRLAELRLLLDAELPRAAVDVERVWSNVRSRAIEGAPSHSAGARAPARWPRRYTGDPRRFNFAAAAALLLSIAAGGGLYMWTRGRPATTPSTAELEAHHYSTSRGVIATIQLLDGSQVTLAPHSRLTISATFGSQTRDVSLDGEAIFSVRHDAAHPFRVRAHGALVEDIGTRFDLRAYENESAVTVAVAEGSVALGRAPTDSNGVRTADAEGVVLRRGEIGTLDKKGAVSASHSTRVASHLAWSRGRLSFVGRPLPEVLLDIGRWYDLDIRVADPLLATRLVTAEFSTQSPSEMIAALALAVDARVERSGRVVTLRAK